MELIELLKTRRTNRRFKQATDCRCMHRRPNADRSTICVQCHEQTAAAVCGCKNAAKDKRSFQPYEMGRFSAARTRTTKSRRRTGAFHRYCGEHGSCECLYRHGRRSCDQQSDSCRSGITG